MKKLIHNFLWLLLWIVISISILGHSLLEWFDLRFGIGLEALLFTLTSPLDGSDASFLEEAIVYMKPSIILTIEIVFCGIVLCFMLKKVQVLINIKIKKLQFCWELHKVYRCILILFGAICFCNTIYFCEKTLGVSQYVSRKLDRTTIYDEYYVHPNETTIVSNGSKKNLICIYMESMETAYSSTEAGGAMKIDYIPNLTAYAQEYVSFSDDDNLGGALPISGTSYTMAALLATTSGVSYSLPIHGNEMDTFEEFLPGITTMGDVLEKEGYKQEFLCGSLGYFAGRQKYFEQHGNYSVLDYSHAVDNGYIPPGYWVWWGYEDEYLYKIAKDELVKLSSDDSPFNLTMLTVDTHHVDGYVCERCDNKYEEQLANVLSCADQQVAEFIEWCKGQDFYEDTVIVIIGDHLRMDTALVGEVENRRIYNCFINSQTEIQGDYQKRQFTSLDMFPTILSSMGYSIEGNRLGLGTDLFSGKQTLAEELGVDILNAELIKYSKYYKEHFE